MDTRTLLAQIRSLADLHLLLRAHGHPPLTQEVPPDALPIPVTEALALGAPGWFQWLAVLTPHPAQSAERLSTLLRRQGRQVGVLALDPQRRELAIAVSVDRTVTATFNCGNPSPLEQERLRRFLALPPAEPGFAARAALALGAEDLGRRFFLAFRSTLEAMAAGMPTPARDEDRRALALIQMTRVLFLYFVQAKGWLDGRPDFLGRAVDDALARRRRIHRDLLRPLFFGTLNRPPGSRGRARTFGRIPFLNGGLFEPHPLERGWRGEIPDEAWRDAFDTVFERFHFTADEPGDPGRIAPDMLGRVFESLMAPAERRESGSFYTPAGLVRRLLDAALSALLVERLGVTGDEAQARLERPDPTVKRLLDGVTLLDPAVGSGAFLLGALERLAGIQEGALPPAALRRRILERNLFGVDLNPMAVRLAELRLWLAVIAADPTGDPEGVAPLPNLDGLIRQGDTLLDPASALGRLGARSSSHADRLRGLRQEFVLASGEEKRVLARRLRRAELEACQACLVDAGQRVERDITECLEAARAPTLFQGKRGLDAELARRLRALREQMTDLRRLRRRLAREGGVPWFSCEVQFGDVLASGGFDLIIGNPPWVRAEHLPARMRAELGRRYRWWRGAGRGFRHQPDLALAFVERSAELLAPRGVAALLVPAKATTAEYGRRMRGALAARCTIHALADLTEDPEARFDATVYPAALVFSTQVPAAGHTVRLALDPASPGGCLQQRMGGGPWLLLPPPALAAIATAHGAHPRLGDRFTPVLGVKTGANAAFLDPPPEVEPALIRVALRGRDIRPFGVRTGVRLFFPHDGNGRVFPVLPPGAAAHVASHAGLLRARVDYQDGPPWGLFRVRGALAPFRVVWADLARRLTASAILPPAGHLLIPLNSCYVIPARDRDTALALAAWLNSTWIRAVARSGADVAAGGFARFNARVISALPLPDTVPGDARLVRLAVRGSAGEAIQEELDEICAAHLTLPDRVRTVLAALAAGPPDHRG